VEGGVVARREGNIELTSTAFFLFFPPSQINATPDEEAGLGELLSTMGVRRPGLRIVSFEMPGKERSVFSCSPPPFLPRSSFLPCFASRRALYHAGGLISVTSRILVVDMLTKNIPTEMISGLVVLHAEK